MKLSQKGILLVSIPLVFELVFIFILTGLLQDAERDVKRQIQSRSVVAQASDLSRLYVESVSTIFAWKMTRTASLLGRFDRLTAQIPDGLKKLEELTSDDPRQFEHVQKMKATGEHALTVLRRYRQWADMSSDQPDLIDKVLATQTPELHVLPAFMDEAKLLEQEEENFQRRSIEGASRQQVKSALVFGVCLNIAITILIAVLFSRQITNRLLVIAENTRLFGEHKPMKALVGGEDEIAQVDGALHNMAENLIKNEEVKQEFVSMITHDLRSPLAALQSTLAVALKGTYGELNETGANRLGRAEKSLERLILLINQLLDLDKLEAGGLQVKISAVPIKPLLEEAAAIVKALADEKTVKVNIESGKQIVAADRERLLQVVVNLLGNAIKFAPSGSEVRVNTQMVGSSIEIKVIDHGPGIKKEDQPAIFERFKQLSPNNNGQPGGSGLGLAICKALVLAQGGTIGVQSEEHQGSQFWILMPASAPPT